MTLDGLLRLNLISSEQHEEINSCAAGKKEMILSDACVALLLQGWRIDLDGLARAAADSSDVEKILNNPITIKLEAMSQGGLIALDEIRRIKSCSLYQSSCAPALARRATRVQ